MAETLARLNATSAINRRIEEKLKDLNLLRFKLRQENITEELAEINAAISAMGEHLFTGAVKFSNKKETLKVSPSIWNYQKEIFRKIYPEAEVFFEEFIAGFIFERINFIPDRKKPSIRIDATVESLLQELQRSLKN